MFREIVDTTGGGLAQFIAEYEKLQQALRKSHESETRYAARACNQLELSIAIPLAHSVHICFVFLALLSFVNKCRELTKQIQTSSEKTQVLSNMLEEEKRQIDTLNTQLGAQREKKDAAAADVDAGRALVKSKRDEMATIGKQLEADAGSAIAEQEARIHRLELQIEEQTRIRDEERAELSAVRTENIALHARYEQAAQDQLAEEKEIRELDDKIAETNNECATEARKKDDLEAALREAKAVFKDRGGALRAQLSELDAARTDLAAADKALADAETLVEDGTNKLHALTASVDELETLLAQTKETNEAHATALAAFSAELDKQRGDADEAKRDAAKRAKMVDAMRAKVAEMEERCAAAVEAKDEWTAKNREVQQTIEAQQVKVNAVAKQSSTAVREREVLSTNTAQKRAAIKSKEQAVSVAHSTLHSMELELATYHQSIAELKRAIVQLKADSEAYAEDLRATELLKARAVEEAAQRELEVTNIQRDTAELESKLRTQQNLLEAVRGDRNAYSKQLIQQKDDMAEQKHKFGHLNIRITQVKQEIADKDAGIVNEHFKLQRLNSDIQDLTRSVASLQTRIAEREQTIQTQTAQITKLTSIIAEAEEETKAQAKQYAAIVSEQRVLNQQLIARNTELAGVYDKLKLQHSLLLKGERSYRDAIESLRRREAQRDALVRQLRDICSDQGEFELVQESTRALEAQLLDERRRVAALEAELERPLNVHRWRQLADTSAETFGLVRRVHDLQREIIARSDEVVAKDGEIQEKEKLYVDLRKVLARQPGPEATEQLRVFALTLKEKKSKFEAMKAELKMYQAKVYEYKYDIEKLTKDIELMKLAYFAQKRAQRQQTQTPYQGGGSMMGGTGMGGGGGGDTGMGYSAQDAAAAYDAFAAQNAALAAAALHSQSQGADQSQQMQQMQLMMGAMGGASVPMDSSSLAAAAAAAIAAANAATDAAASRTLVRVGFVVHFSLCRPVSCCARICIRQCIVLSLILRCLIPHAQQYSS